MRVDEFTKLLVRSLHPRLDYNTDEEARVVDVMWALQEQMADASGRAYFPASMDCPELNDPAAFFNGAFTGAHRENRSGGGGGGGSSGSDASDDDGDDDGTLHTITTADTQYTSRGNDSNNDHVKCSGTGSGLSTQQVTILFALLMDRLSLVRICALRREAAGIAVGRAGSHHYRTAPENRPFYTEQCECMCI